MKLKPEKKPSNPYFSSGPCAKRPGWNTKVLSEAVLGRSHRSKVALKKISDVLDLTKEILGIPEDYKVGIVPASDTGAIEMLMWSMLGYKPLEVLAWESFGMDWVKDINEQLKINNTKTHLAEYGKIVDLQKVNFNHDVLFTWNGTTSGVTVPDGNWIDDKREGITFCDATSAVFSMDLPWKKLDATTFSWQKVLGGEAQHGVIVMSPKALKRLELFTPDRPIPKIFQLVQNGKVNLKLYSGSTINTPSMLCFEDVLDSLIWVRSIGGLKKTIALSKNNLFAVEEKIVHSTWLDFLAEKSENRSCTSICLKIKESICNSFDRSTLEERIKNMLLFFENENIAYDINSYRDAPLGIRIWGGATVNSEDIKLLLDWLEWGYYNFIKEKK